VVDTVKGALTRCTWIPYFELGSVAASDCDKVDNDRLAFASMGEEKVVET
jgi:hypothetical protein